MVVDRSLQNDRARRPAQYKAEQLA